MKKRNMLLKSLALAACVVSLWSCSKDKDPIQEDEGDAIGTVYLDEKFDKMIWGGDYVKQLTGVKGVFIRDENNKYIIDESKPVDECSIGSDGCPDFFDTASEAYKTLRGINNWDGWKVYERPGYLKVGTSTSRDAFVSTPPLKDINDEKVNVKVSVSLAIWEGSSETLYINVVNGGTPSVGQLQVTSSDSWTSKEFTILNATKNTKIAIKSDPTQVGRFLMDNFKVVKVE